ncbi:hypothetical protein MMC26_003704 [Xylographa opegraphella]|nr:hypothetical protein [Xylographa opegraphella]
MNPETPSFPFASADQPVGILLFLIQQNPKFVIPAGPYFNFKSPNSRPRSTYDVEYFADILAEIRRSKGVELTGTADNILRYIIAGLIKHNGLFTFCHDFEGNEDLQHGCEALIEHVDTVIAELYNGETLTDGQLIWIKSEQTQTIRVVERYPEVLEATCRANERMVDVISNKARSSEKNGQACIEVKWLWVKVRETYIDLAAVGRVNSRTLNTVQPRYRIYHEQDELCNDLLDFLEDIVRLEPLESGLG